MIESRGDQAAQIDDCVREPNTLYTLTFDPAPAEHADEYHDLEVEVREPGLKVRSNTFYYDQPYYLDTPNSAIEKVTVAQLDQLLSDAQGKSDDDLARQLTGLELTERANDTEVTAWTAKLHGKKAQEALIALVDASVFLAPPPGDIPTDAPPDENAQQQMLAQVNGYLNTTIPRLPNFFARRTALRYEENSTVLPGNAKFSTPEPLHVIVRSKDTVLYRGGIELVDTKASRHGKPDRS